MRIILSSFREVIFEMRGWSGDDIKSGEFSRGFLLLFIDMF